MSQILGSEMEEVDGGGQGIVCCLETYRVYDMSRYSVLVGGGGSI